MPKSVSSRKQTKLAQAHPHVSPQVRILDSCQVMLNPRDERQPARATLRRKTSERDPHACRYIAPGRARATLHFFLCVCPFPGCAKCLKYRKMALALLSCWALSPPSVHLSRPKNTLEHNCLSRSIIQHVSREGWHTHKSAQNYFF